MTRNLDQYECGTVQDRVREITGIDLRIFFVYLYSRSRDYLIIFHIVSREKIQVSMSELPHTGNSAIKSGI